LLLNRRARARLSIPCRLASAGALALAIAQGCSSPSDAPSGAGGSSGMRCTATFAGDPDAGVEVAPGLVVSNAFSPLHEGDAVPLVTPPQGGHVAFIAARARNVAPCGLSLKATLRSPRTGLIAAEEERTIDYAEIPDSGGWAEPPLDDITNVANIPACPDYGAESVVDATYTLVVTVTDKGGRVGQTSLTVVPRCEQTDDYDIAACRCECSANYVLGRCGDPIDGGWLEGGGPNDAGTGDGS
jgi:hypothetical protein